MTGEVLPTGTVTFLLTDIAGSTRLWQEHPSAMNGIIERHDRLIEDAVTSHGGAFVKSKGEGDSTFSVFTRPSNALGAAMDLQRSLATEDWPAQIRLRARASLHTGEADLRDGDYYGTTVNRCARLRAVAHGGQTVCSRVTAELVADISADLRSLGNHRLKDLERSEQIYQVGDGDFPPLRSLDAYRHNLPTQRTSFIGRADEILLVRKHLEQNRLVTLTGVGGCGKTRLALQVAADLLDGFTDGVFFIELAPVSDPDVIWSTVASAVGVAGGLSASGRSIRDQLLEALTARTLLLVLDNCEHLIGASAELVDDVLARCPDVRVLATSREAFGIEGEQSHPVPSLDVPAQDGDQDSDAILLFRDRASSVRESFELTPEVVPHVVQICRRLDGIPLAIELAAAQVAHLSASQIAERLYDRFGLLTGGRRRVQRQQTLAAALDWSYELLTEDERGALRRLAVFPGTFSLEAAEALGTNASLVRALVAKSMIVTEEGDEIRYRLLETVRLYAEEKLLTAGESEAMRTAHRDFFVRWVAPFSLEVWTSPSTMKESHNLRAALAWSEQQGRSDLVGRLAAGALAMWVAGDTHEGARWLEMSLDARDRLTVDELVKILCARADVGIVMLEQPATITDWARRAIEAAEGARVRWVGRAHGIIAFMRSWEAAMGIEVGDDVEQHASLARERATDEEDLVGGLGYAGLAYMNMGDHSRAVETFEAIRRSQVDDLDFPAMTSLCTLYHVAGKHAAALEVSNDARRQTIEAFGDWRLLTVSGHALALAGLGRFEEALTEIRCEVREIIAARLPAILVTIVSTLGAIAALLEDWERASVLFGKAREYYARGEIRSPAEGVVYRHYVQLVRDAVGARANDYRERASSMSLEEALEYGLDLSFPSA